MYFFLIEIFLPVPKISLLSLIVIKQDLIKVHFVVCLFWCFFLNKFFKLVKQNKSKTSLSYFLAGYLLYCIYLTAKNIETIHMFIHHLKYIKFPT